MHDESKAATLALKAQDPVPDENQTTSGVRIPPRKDC
jgi:hypothetical protein